MGKMLKLLSIYVVVILVVTLSLTGSAKATPPAKELILGITAALSGPFAAAYGIPVERALRLAIEDIGEFKVGGQPYRWIPVVINNEYTTRGQLAAVNKLIYSHKAKFIQVTGSEVAIASLTLTDPNKVIVMGDSINTKFLRQGKYCFNTQNTFTGLIGGIGWLIKNRPDLKKWTFLMVDNPTGHGGEELLRRTFAGYGISEQVLGSVYIKPGISDFYPLLPKILAGNPDAIHFSALGEGGYFIKQVREAGFKGQLVCSTPRTREVWRGICGNAGLEGLIFCDAAYDDTETLPTYLADFAKRLEARYGVGPVGLDIWEVGGLYLLTEALKKAGTVDDADRIMELIQTETFDLPWVRTACKWGEPYWGTPRGLVMPAFISQYSETAKGKLIGKIEPEKLFEIIKGLYAK